VEKCIWCMGNHGKLIKVIFHGIQCHAIKALRSGISKSELGYMRMLNWMTG
jgi:hypothetical protein